MRPSLAGVLIGVAATSTAFIVHDSLHGWGNLYTRALAAGVAAMLAAVVLWALFGAFTKR